LTLPLNAGAALSALRYGSLRCCSRSLTENSQTDGISLWGVSLSLLSRNGFRWSLSSTHTTTYTKNTVTFDENSGRGSNGTNRGQTAAWPNRDIGSSPQQDLPRNPRRLGSSAQYRLPRHCKCKFSRGGQQDVVPFRASSGATPSERSFSLRPLLSRS
jgi:hypothetical protein